MELGNAGSKGGRREEDLIFYFSSTALCMDLPLPDLVSPLLSITQTFLWKEELLILQLAWTLL